MSEAMLFVRKRHLKFGEVDHNESAAWKENLDLFGDDIVSPLCSDPNWSLNCCCGHEEIIFISLFFGYLLANFFLWNSLLLKPMKLIAIFVHEVHHAMACWITGGKIQRPIEIHDLEGGGVSKYEGGRRCIIVPAGYVGCAFWGSLLVTLSGDRTASFVSACVFLFALVVSLCYSIARIRRTQRRLGDVAIGTATSRLFSPNRTTILLSLGFCVLTVAFILMDRYLFSPLLQFLTLFYGVFVASFSLYDIFDDLITRPVERSDAHACHELMPFCNPRIVGLQFVLLALALQGIGLYLALVYMTSLRAHNTPYSP